MPKSITVGGDKLQLEPITLVNVSPHLMSPDLEAYLADDESIVLVRGRRVTHHFPKGTPNREALEGSYHAS